MVSKLGLAWKPGLGNEESSPGGKHKPTPGEPVWSSRTELQQPRFLLKTSALKGYVGWSFVATLLTDLTGSSEHAQRTPAVLVLRHASEVPLPSPGSPFTVRQTLSRGSRGGLSVCSELHTNHVVSELVLTFTSEDQRHCHRPPFQDLSHSHTLLCWMPSMNSGTRMVQ